MNLLPVSILSCMALLGLAPGTSAQCAPQWLGNAGLGTAVSTDVVNTLTVWDADGAGPQAPLLVVGGNFVTIGGITVNRIATFNVQTGVWAGLSGGVQAASGPFGSTGDVRAAVVGANNQVYIAGNFTSVGGFLLPGIARWNGSVWSNVGFPIFTSSWPNQLLKLPNGDILALGSALGPMLWDGVSWNPGTAPLGGGQFRTAALDAAGNLLMGTSNGVYRQSGTSWTQLGGGADVWAIAVHDGQIIAAGTFTSIAGVAANSIARFDGSTWSPLGSGVSGGISSLGEVTSLAVLPNGDLVAGGTFTQAGGAAANRLARWDGTSWSALGSGVDNRVRALVTVPGGQLAVGGEFNNAGGSTIRRFALYTSTCVATTAVGGAGCAGSGGANVLTAMSDAWIGGNFTARATGLPSSGNVLAIGVYGFSAAAQPLAAILPQGLPGCVLHSTDDILFGYVAAAGTVDTSVAIPDSVLLAGQFFHHQVLPIELDANQVITAVSATNSLVVTVGAL